MSGGMAGVSVCQQRGGEREASWVLSATPPPPTRRPKLSRRTQSTPFHPISACEAPDEVSGDLAKKFREKWLKSLKVEEKGEAKEEKEAGAGERSCRDAVSSPTNLLPKLPFGLNSRTSENHTTIKQELDKKLVLDLMFLSCAHQDIKRRQKYYLKHILIKSKQSLPHDVEAFNKIYKN